MNLQKIGAYIAQKRKALGMTQTELAEKLGMSNKSVSKWERGVCLPDVSLYMELCNILGISLNEFVAGEDFEKDSFLEKTEENIIQMSREGEAKKRRYKLFTAIATVILIIMCVGMIALYMYYTPKQNYIEPVSDRVKLLVERQLEGSGSPHLFQFNLDETYQRVILSVTEQQNGEPVSSFQLLETSLEGGINEGLISIITDFNRHDIEVLVYQDKSTDCEKAKLMENVNLETFEQFSGSIPESKSIVKGQELELYRVEYGKDNEYACSFSVTFE